MKVKIIKPLPGFLSIGSEDKYLNHSFEVIVRYKGYANISFNGGRPKIELRNLAISSGLPLLWTQEFKEFIRKGYIKIIFNSSK